MPPITSKSKFLRKEIPLPVTTRDIASYCRGFSILLESGISVLQGLRILSERSSNPTMRKVIAEVVLFVEHGGTVSGGMAKYPKYFDHLLISVVKVGETSGTLDKSFHRAADLLEKRVALQHKIKNAMAYPVIALLTALGVVIFLLVRVIPVFIPIFENSERKMQIPVPTQFIIYASNVLTGYWMYYIPILAALAFLFVLYSRTQRGKYIYDKICFKVPLMGNLYTKVVMARFCRTMAVLLKSGVPLLESLRLVKPATGSINMEDTIQECHDVLEKGGTLEETLWKCSIIPPLMVEIIAIGEKTGNLEDVFRRIADNYDEEIDVSVKGIASIIEPVMVLVVGGVVLFIALSVFLPYFALIKIL